MHRVCVCVYSWEWEKHRGRPSMRQLVFFVVVVLFFLDKHMLVPSLVLGWVDLEHQFVFGPCTILSAFALL